MIKIAISTVLLALACSDVISGGTLEDPEMCGSSFCFVNTTCCNWQSGSGCCQYQNAVCCSDGASCCPSGSTCNSETGDCDTQDGGSVTSGRSFVRGRKQEKIVHQATDVVLCDSAHYCPNGMTCCRLKGGQWGCCPLPSAVCCADLVNCCPNGSTCSSSGCVSSDGEKVSWLRKTRAFFRL